jgi:acetoin utilization deacetylase AcuC-like enzyme
MPDADLTRPVFLSHPSSLDHRASGDRFHPEQPARIVAIERELERHAWFGARRIASPEVAREALLRVHPASHIEMIEAIDARGGGQIDLDTGMSAGSLQAALHAAGGAVRLVELLVSEEAPSGFSAHRPPGHHAPRAQAMGFCLFNNIAVAAQHALDALGLERVMILDWDVHHGNGTHDIFYASDRVLFVSIHQSPLYPGSGRPSEIGSGAGTGYTVNLPVPPGSGDAEFGSLVTHVAAPLAHSFAPQLLLVSAGYDAHHEDPLAECDVTDAGFAAMTVTVRALAESLGIPVGLVLEGGYDLRALARGVAGSIEVLASPAAAAAAGSPSPSPSPSPEVSPLAHAARARLAEYWPALGDPL